MVNPRAFTARGNRERNPHDLPVRHREQQPCLEPARVFTPARIVALALIALAVLGLAYLRFAPDVGLGLRAAGAKAGDLILESCDYATENGSYEADCGTLVVPENRADPHSRLIACR